MRTLTLGAILLLAAGASTADGPAVTIKLKNYPDKGQTILCRETEKHSNHVRFFDDKGKQIGEQKPTAESEEVYLLTVVTPGDKLPQRYTHSFDKAVYSNGIRTQVKDYQGHKLEFELQDGKYQLKAGPRANLSDAEKQALADRANSEVEAPLDGMFQPDSPVEVGDSWSIDVNLLHKAFGRQGKLDLEKTRGQARLAKVYKKDGIQYGVIEVSLSIAFKEMGNQHFDPPAELAVKAVLDAAIDGSSSLGTLTIVSKLTGKGHIVQAGMKVPLEILRESTVKKERSNPEQ